MSSTTVVSTHRVRTNFLREAGPKTEAMDGHHDTGCTENGALSMTTHQLTQKVQLPMQSSNSQDFPHSQPSCIIQKFGGTSLGKYSPNIVNNVIKPYSTTSKVVAVCSARSLDTKLGGTTNRLLGAARNACALNSAASIAATIQSIQADHMEAAHGYIKCPHIVLKLSEEIEKQCTQVTTLLSAARTLGETTHSCVDRVVSIGEKLSAQVLCAMLQDQGIPAAYIDLTNAIDFQVNRPLDRESYDHMASRLGQVVQACSSRVVVVTGYFGSITGGLLGTIGRGYTDLCAALLAIGIPGSQLQIWKEMDGIFTADPRQVRTARLLQTISPAEAAELTFYGSEVIHPLAMKQAVRHRIPIKLFERNPQGRGSLVLPESEVHNTYSGSITHLMHIDDGNAADDLSDASCDFGRPIALTTKGEIMIIRVQSTERYLSHSFFAKVFTTLEKWRLSVDLMSTSEVQVSMALYSKAPQVIGDTGDNDEIINHDLHGAIRDLRNYGRVELAPDMAIMSIIGRHVRSTLGLAGSILSTLGRNHIHVEMISQGASDVSMSCVIEEKNVERATCILHDQFFSPSDATV